MTWLSGWTRRKIKIVENLTVSDYQMKLIIHKSGSGPDTTTDIYLGGNCRDDFADLRFTGPDETTLLSYWIESITGTTPNFVATVWIKIPTLIPTNNIYVYYDNASQTTTSNGTNTFGFFDDFSGNLSKWSQAGAVWSITGGVLKSGNVGNPGASAYLRTLNTIDNINSTETVFRARYWDTSTDPGTRRLAFGSGTDSTPDYTEHDLNVLFGTAHNKIFWDYNDNTFTSISTIEGTWYKLKSLRYSAGTSRFGVYTDGTDSILAEKTDTILRGSGSYFAFGIPYMNMDVDWLYVRKYTSPEPTFGVSGTEELGITATNMILNTNTCAGPCQITADVTWQNLGSSNMTFTPAILIDGTTIVYATSNITIGPYPAEGSSTITTPTLSIGPHTICPYPN